MNFGKLGVAVGLAAALVGAASYAGEDRHVSGHARHTSSTLQAVAVAAQPGEPGHGWQYFRDARRSRAVVISPGGDYYYSHGDGLELVFKAGRAG